MKKVVRKVAMGVEGGFQKYQLFFEDNTYTYAWWNLSDNYWSSNFVSGTLNDPQVSADAPLGEPSDQEKPEEEPKEEPGGSNPPIPEGKKETRRYMVGFEYGYQQWRVVYDDDSTQDFWFNVNQSSWTDNNPFDGQDVPPEEPPSDGTGPGDDNWPPIPEGKTLDRRVMMETTGSGIQRWQVIYTDGTSDYFYFNLNDKTWGTVNPDTGEELPPGPDVPDVVDGVTNPTNPTNPTPPPGPTGPTMAYDVFRDIMISLLGITDDTLLKDIYNASGRYIADGVSAYMIPDLLAGSPDAPESFKLFIGGFNKIKALDIGITTIAEFTRARNDYKALMRYYGLDEYVSDDVADQFMANAVSVNEASARMEAAFNAIKYADAALKEQLKTYFPSLTDTDIAASILGVGETVAELQKKIGVSGIRAEAATMGVTGKLSAEELFAQGVSRERARQGYQEVKFTQPLAEAAAIRARQEPATIQEELEKESLLGLRSKRRAQLAAREQAYFAGKSGTSNVSLGESTSGQF